MAPDAAVREIEDETRAKFSGAFYDPTAICGSVGEESSYHERLLAEKLSVIRSVAAGAKVLDVGCGNGLHVLDLAPVASHAAGVDFSVPALAEAERRRAAIGAENVSFLAANARRLCFLDASFDLVYSLSALYYMPDVNEVLSDVARVLVPGGRCLLDMGNVSSLNTLVCRAHPETARACHITVGQMRDAIRKAGLVVESHRSFQLLPLWGNRPRWLRPLLWRGWPWLLRARLGRRMLDERISSLPLLRSFAFRHLFLCRKHAPGGRGGA